MSNISFDNKVRGETTTFVKRSDIYYIDELKYDINDTVKDLDLKLNRVLNKQEYDYL